MRGKQTKFEWFFSQKVNETNSHESLNPKFIPNLFENRLISLYFLSESYWRWWYLGQFGTSALFRPIRRTTTATATKWRHRGTEECFFSGNNGWWCVSDEIFDDISGTRLCQWMVIGRCTQMSSPRSCRALVAKGAGILLKVKFARNYLWKIVKKILCLFWLVQTVQNSSFEVSLNLQQKLFGG